MYEGFYKRRGRMKRKMHDARMGILGNMHLHSNRDHWLLKCMVFFCRGVM
jgi:hypothetical protein